jgi:DNA-directed RNA polymerase subunit L
MKFKKISEKDNELEFELQGEDHTFAGILVSKLLEDKNVEIAQYDIPHPLVGHPTFLIRTKKGEPRKALKDALADLKKDVKTLMK